MSSALVLTTVNAPHSKQLDAKELAFFLLNPEAAKTAPGHMSSFFAEVSPKLQIEFAYSCGITGQQFAAAAKAFAIYSGESYPLAA